VLAATSGRIVRLSRSSRGGLEVRQIDESSRLCFYYAHLLRYARGLREDMPVTAGAVLAYVGSSGNAPEHAPHLHFGVFRAAAGGCSSEALDPLSLLTR
jgi:peptidoglycan LD-endopeptidase LytH